MYTKTAYELFEHACEFYKDKKNIQAYKRWKRRQKNRRKKK